MNRLKIFLLPIILLMGTMAQAQKSVEFYLLNGYSVTIRGGSNLHDWSEKVEKARATGHLTWNGTSSFDINSLKVTFDVNSIKSSEGSIMNNKTYKALKNTQYPQITFVLTSPVKGITADGKAQTINVPGNLTIAGVSRPVTLIAKTTASGNKIISEGALAVKMSDYKIEQVTALFGTLKVSNDVSIDFKTSFAINNN